LGVHEQLHYLGFVSHEELQSMFASATALIFPSKFEGFGLPILEAFHARLPVLSPMPPFSQRWRKMAQHISTQTPLQSLRR